MYGFSFFLFFSVTRSFFPYIQKPNEWRNVSEKIVPNMHIYCSLHGLFSADYSKKKQIEKKKSEKHSAHIFTLTFKYIYNSKTTFLCCRAAVAGVDVFKSAQIAITSNQSVLMWKHQTSSKKPGSKLIPRCIFARENYWHQYSNLLPLACICNNINIWIMT